MPPRDRRSISYDQFTTPKRRWPRRLAYIGIPVVIAVGVAAATYQKLDRHALSPLDTTAPAALAKANGPTRGESYRWSRVAIGGGGFITGISMDPAGKTFLARTDVYGAYIWNAGDDRWHQLATVAAMPEANRKQDGIAQGAYEIVVAPSQPDRIYMAIKGTVYRSDDRGAHFAAPQSGPFPLTWSPISGWRLYGPFMAVDPTNPDLVLLGTPGQGLWRSVDGARNWQQVATVPPTRDVGPEEGHQGPGSQVWFETGKGGKPTGRIFAFSSGNGMYVSDDRGATFKPLASEGQRPTTLKRGAFTRNGVFIGADADAKTIWSYADGRWHNLGQENNLAPGLYGAVAADPRSDRVVVLDDAGGGYISPDGGKSWSSVTWSVAVGKGDPPWLRISDVAHFSTAEIMFDPIKPNRLWLAHGVGVFYADLKNPGDTQLAWVSQARGMEELVANDVVQVPGHAPMFAAWDFGLHIKHDLNAYSTRFAPDRNFIAVQQVDWTPADTSFLVTNATDTRPCCSEDGNAVMAGYSTDGGSTWTKFASLPTPPGTKADDPWRMSYGTIAVSSGDTDNIVWQPGQNRAPFFTKDRGKTWQQIMLPGAQGDTYGSFQNTWVQRKTLAADKSEAGVFYLAHSGEAPNQMLAGLWRSRDGGETWEQAYAGELAFNSGSAAKLRSVPGKAGHLFFTSAVTDGETPLRRSNDGGTTWISVPDVSRVDDVAFGKAAAGAGYPTIYISGQVRGVYGVWRSVDDARSWQQLVDFPVGTLDQVTVIAADPDVFGRVYLGYQGSGWIWGEPAPCKAVPYAAFATKQCSAVRP